VILATQYEEGVPGSGKLLVIPEIDGVIYEATVLLDNLDRPKAVCFDINHSFMYISDLGYTNSGAVFQLEIEWIHD